MPESYDGETRSRCKNLYCYDGHSIAEIARMMPPSESTLRRWKEEDDWEDQKMAKEVSGRMIAEQLKRQVHMIVEEANSEGRLLTNAEVDRIRKMRSDIEKLDDTEIRIGHALDTIDELGDWMAEHYPDLHEQLVQPLMEFSRELVRSA
jgi:transposase